VILCTLYLGAQVREGSALVGEGGVIHNVPMKHIELVVGHCILEVVVRTVDTTESVLRSQHDLAVVSMHVPNGTRLCPEVGSVETCRSLSPGS